MVYNFRQKTVLETQVFNGKNLLLIFSLICSACIYVCVCMCSYLQQCHALGVIPIFFLSGVYSPRTFYGEQLAPLSACVLLDCTIFVWPLNQMGSCFPSCLVAFLCHSLRTQVLDTQSCSLNVEEGPYSAADTAVPLWGLSSLWGLWLQSPSLCQQSHSRTFLVFPMPFLAEKQMFVKC